MVIPHVISYSAVSHSGEAVDQSFIANCAITSGCDNYGFRADSRKRLTVLVRHGVNCSSYYFVSQLVKQLPLVQFDGGIVARVAVVEDFGFVTSPGGTEIAQVFDNLLVTVSELEAGAESEVSGIIFITESRAHGEL